MDPSSSVANDSSSSVDDIVVVASSSSNDSSSVFADAGEGKTTSSNVGDSCTWYDDGTCTRPRTGYDCLNTLLTTDSCAIDPHGVCVSMSSYQSYLANRYYYTPLQRYFPSAEYTYCSANDSICSACTSEWQATYSSTGSAGPSTYCIGANGCVCVADCEVQDWKASAINYECNPNGSGSDSANPSMGLRITISVVVGLAVALLLAFATWAVRRFIRERNYPPALRHDLHTRRRPPPKGPQLTLGGWNSLRQKLIDAENGFMNAEPVTLQRDAVMDTTAPANEDAAVINVEEGEGFRPASPSELERRAHEGSHRETSNL